MSIFRQLLYKRTVTHNVVQLVRNTSWNDGSDWIARNGTSYEILGDGGVKVTLTQGSSSYCTGIKLERGHRYLVCMKHKSSSISVGIGTSNALSGISSRYTFNDADDYRVDSYIFSYGINVAAEFTHIGFRQSEDFTDKYIKTFQVIDLTETFGEGNEPLTVKDVCRLLGYASIEELPVYPYNAE